MGHLGHGVGLRTRHFPHVLAEGPTGVDWVEIISENFFEPGGRPWAVLEKVRASVPVVCHGVSLGIGNTSPLDADYLQSLRALIDRVQPAWVSDHLCWGGSGGHYAHDLLPLPYTEETLAHVVGRIDCVQQRLGRRMLIENVSSYVGFRASNLTEWDFLNEVARRADCHILLDVNNILVSAFNHKFDASVYVDAIAGDRIAQVHLAGHSQKHTNQGSYLFDSHTGPVPASVWDLYRRLVERVGPRPTLVEWDEDVPAYEVVVAESRRAAEIESEIGQNRKNRNNGSARQGHDAT